jgi:hypothetical protein
MKKQGPMTNLVLVLISLVCLASPHLFAQEEPGFTSLFDGQSLQGWRLVGKRGGGYGVKDGAIYCAKGGGGNLFTEKEYSDFVLRFEYKPDDGANNGVGIRAPFEGRTSRMGMEIQILEEGAASAGKLGQLRNTQLNGSIYEVIPARQGAQKMAGEWNSEEITAQGRRVTVVLNGQTIVDADLNRVTSRETLEEHPGLLRDRGHIGFLGHNDYVEFRHIRIRELPRAELDNTPPEGFTALFNGRDLKGWKGLLASPYDNPFKRAKLSAEDRAARQKDADQNMLAHWKAENGEIVFDGKGRSLCTAKDYADFEMLVDWKIPPHGDSGIYLRGSPQVQIWDPYTQPPQHESEIGSGGLYNNKKHPSNPLKVVDHPIGEWNRFRILMVGDKVHVFLNGELVVNDVTLENYWDYSQPIFASGQIELQNHGGKLWFKNLYIRPIPAP